MILIIAILLQCIYRYFKKYVPVTDFNLKLQVKDPRFEWTRDKMLVLREVTHADQGLYAIKMSSEGFTYETVNLTVSGKSVFLRFMGFPLS